MSLDNCLRRTQNRHDRARYEYTLQKHTHINDISNIIRTETVYQFLFHSLHRFSTTIITAPLQFHLCWDIQTNFDLKQTQIVHNCGRHTLDACIRAFECWNFIHLHRDLILPLLIYSSLYFVGAFSFCSWFNRFISIFFLKLSELLMEIG